MFYIPLLWWQLCKPLAFSSELHEMVTWWFHFTGQRYPIPSHLIQSCLSYILQNIHNHYDINECYRAHLHLSRDTTQHSALFHVCNHSFISRLIVKHALRYISWGFHHRFICECCLVCSLHWGESFGSSAESSVKHLTGTSRSQCEQIWCSSWKVKKKQTNNNITCGVSNSLTNPTPWFVLQFIVKSFFRTVEWLRY